MTPKFTDKILIAQVAPAINLPRGIIQSFSYIVPENISSRVKIGSVVTVSFRKRNITGVVFELNRKNLQKIEYKLKDIEDVIDSISLSKNQIELAVFISRYYHTPLGLVMKAIIPQTVKRKPRKSFDYNRDCQLIAVKSESVKKLDSALDKEDKILLIHDYPSSRHDLYARTIEKQLKNNRQALLLMPEYFDVYNFAKYYIEKFGIDKVAMLTSELTKNQFFSEWKKVSDGTAKVAIGTRVAVFAPFSNLGLVIADDEHNSSYKQWDQNPRYHTIKAACKLADIWKCKLVLSSPAPSVESYFRYRKGELSKIDFRENTSRKLEIIDINEERKSGNYKIISEKLRDALSDTVYNRHQAVIFIPRLGNNTVIQCRDCGRVTECGTCKGTLIFYQNQLYCPRCKEKTALTKECPGCKGQNIGMYGYGSERIEKEVEDIFEAKNIKITRLDSGSVKDKSGQLKIYKDFMSRKIDILSGTQMVIKNWCSENVSLFSMIMPEIIFHQPDFNSRERSFQLLSSILAGAGRNQRIIVETLKPDHKIFQYLKSDPDTFYLDEINKRKTDGGIGYPPFSRLIKLIYKSTSEFGCRKEAYDLHRTLSEKIKDNTGFSGKFELEKPFAASSYKEHGKYRWYIIIKSIADIELRDSLLSYVKKDWIVDIDPDSIM